VTAHIARHWFTELSVSGLMDIDGVFQCYTLEPPQRAEKPCAIPAGTYQVILMWSNHFGRVTPHVLNVPGFTEIEWHHGNYPKDTEGCALVGTSRGPDVVLNSDQAFVEMMSKLPQQFEVEYIDAPERAISA
jgi:hypothetical protein